jgi:hypothetical protein
MAKSKRKRAPKAVLKLPDLEQLSDSADPETRTFEACAQSLMVFDHHREHSEGLKKLLTKRSHSYRIKP